ncbi:MAG: SWIM zinc finger family protein, partial [Myxococcaceae bacterium]
MSAAATLLEAVREAARPGLWSAGVNLSRAGAVVQESASGGEVVLRVRAPGRPVACTVVLYPGDDAWECDCPGRVDPCEHVVAAAISLQQAETGQASLPAAAARWSRVVYRFSRAEGGLALSRVLAQADGSEAPLDKGLAPLLANPVEKAKLQLEQCDLLADRALERPFRGPFPPERLEGLLGILEPARNVLLDGRPVAVSGEVVVPRVLVEDRGRELVVTIGRDPRITEVVSPGVALCGEALCRLGETSLTGAWLEKLPVVR